MSSSLKHGHGHGIWGATCYGPKDTTNLKKTRIRVWNVYNKYDMYIFVFLCAWPYTDTQM